MYIYPKKDLISRKKGFSNASLKLSKAFKYHWFYLYYKDV